MRLLALAFTLALLHPLTGQVCGDCDQDGDFDIVDALLGAQHGAGLLTIPAAALPACDVDADADVDILDALQIAQAAAGLFSLTSCSFPPPPGGSFDIMVNSVTAYFNLQPPVAPDPLLIFFEVSYDNQTGAPEAALLTAAEIELQTSPSGPIFLQSLTVSPDTSGVLAAGSAALINHVKTSGTPSPPPSWCSATGILHLTFDVGGVPVQIDYPGIALFCVY